METTAENPENESNPYAYLDRDGFCSENFKVEIKNLPKFYGIGELKKLLNEKLNLKVSKWKTMKRGSKWMFVCFRSEEDRDNALNVLNDYEWKGNKLKASLAKPMPDPLVKKRNLDVDKESKRLKTSDNVPQDEKLKNSTTPYWRMTYEEQLSVKEKEVRQILKKLGNQLTHMNPDLKSWLDSQKAKHDNLPCEFWSIRPSPETEGYRNKCEFTIGMDQETNLPTVGFRLGSYVSGFTGVAPVEHLIHLPDKTKKAVKIFEKFVRSSSLPPYNPESQTGYFRQLTVRYSKISDELMLIAGVHLQNLTSEEITKLKDEIRDFFLVGEGKELNVTSLYFQPLGKREKGKTQTVEHIHGETHIHDTILGLKFRISPEAFFQANTKGAETVYSAAIELAEPDENTTVVDICCGTGTIGLCFAQKCGQVLGLEVIPQAVMDAKENMKINNITNCDFFAGKAEDILYNVMYRATKPNIISIVDPPRAGLHPKAVVQLRKTKNLNKLVYISCDPSAATKNFVDLGRSQSKTMYGDPFVPIRAVAVDLFPYTNHYELIIYFERFRQSDRQADAATSENVEQK